MKRLGVLLIGLGLLASSCAAPGSSVPGSVTEGSPPSGSVQEPPLPASPLASEGQAADGDVAGAASELTGALTGNDRFASVEVLKGQEIVVHWDGPVDSKLRDLMNRFPSIRISVKTTSCSPGKLSDYGSKLMATDPTVNIVSVAPDGSSLQLTLDESVEATSDVAGLERKHSEAVGCPVKVEFGGVAPIGN